MAQRERGARDVAEDSEQVALLGKRRRPRRFDVFPAVAALIIELSTEEVATLQAPYTPRQPTRILTGPRPCASQVPFKHKQPD